RDHSYIGLTPRRRGSGVCRPVTLKNGCLLEEGSVIGSDVTIGAGSTVNANVRIWPNKEVEPGAVVHESIIWAGSWKRGLFSSYGLNGRSNIEITPELAPRRLAAHRASTPSGAEVTPRASQYETGRITRRDGQTDRYMEDMLAKIDLEVVRGAAFKVVIDYNNGAAAMVLPQILRELNCSVIPLNAAPAEIVLEQDDPTFRAHLQEMGVITAAVKAKLGVFIDTPGERCFIVDETGTVLDHDTAFAVLTQLALTGKPGMILGPASSSLAFSMIGEQMGSRFVPTKITPGAVLRAAQHAEAVLASDGNGGYCWPDFAISFDAIFTIARVLELLAKGGTSRGGLRR